MDSFKVHLPSNACHTLYPKNTASDFRTHFDKAIILEGNWEVGVESVLYSAHINDKHECASIELAVKEKKTTPVNSLYPWKFALTANGTWQGFEGVFPETYEKDPTNAVGILTTLNDMLHIIVIGNSPNIPPLYQFKRDKEGKVVYTCEDGSFTLMLTQELGKALGYGDEHVFSGDKDYIAIHKPVYTSALTKDSYLLRYFNANVQRKTQRVFLDTRDFLVYKYYNEQKNGFLHLWNNAVLPHVVVHAVFNDDKLVLSNTNRNIGLHFSPDFRKTFPNILTFFGNTEQWASDLANFNSFHSNDVWYVDLYSTELDVTEDYVYTIFSLDLFPRKFSTTGKALHYLNKEVNENVKRVAKSFYHDTKHRFKFGLELTGHCTLEMGDWIYVHNMSQNLSHLLGLPPPPLKYSVKGTREAGTLINRSRQLYVLSDIVQPTSHGSSSLPILCDFLHRNGNTTYSVEKRFIPISYIPVLKSRLDSIHLQLTDEHYQPVKINDTKTLITLYFRRIL